VSGWVKGIAIGVGLALLWLGFRIDLLGRWEARLLLLAFAPLAVLRVAMSLSDLGGRGRTAAAVVAVLAVFGAEIASVEALVPPTPFGVARLDTGHPDADIDVPGRVPKFSVAVHGELAGERTAEVRYGIEVARGDTHSQVYGKLSRKIRKGRRFRRSAPSSQLVLHETDVHELALGDAPIAHLHLMSLQGTALSQIEVRLASPPWGEAMLPPLLAAIAFAGLVAQGIATRRGRKVSLAPGIIAAAVFGITVSTSYNPDQPFTFAVGATLLGLLAAGAGWLLSAIVGHFVRPLPSPAPDDSRTM